MVEVLVKSSFTEGARVLYPEWTLSALTQKLEYITGIPPESQQLRLITSSRESLFTISNVHDSTRTVESLNIPGQSTLVVDDTRDPENQLNLEDDGTDPLPSMTEEQYEKRSGTVLEFKRQNKLGRFSDEISPPPVNKPSSVETFTLDDVQVPLNGECFVRLSSGQTVRGVVAFIGEVPNIEPGTWVGVRLFTPDGRNNGIVKGTKLFDADEKHGVLVRPVSVRPLLDDEEEL